MGQGATGVAGKGSGSASIAALVERGGLRVMVEEVLPMGEVAKAHELSETGRVKGKIVLTM